MINCEKCEDMQPYEGGTFWMLTNETQKIDQVGESCIPAIDIEEAESFAYYCSEEHALCAVNDYLLLAGATPQWSGVDPIETCACCGANIDTSQFHRVLVLSVESGTWDDMVQEDCSYPARFCNTCVPVKSMQSVEVGVMGTANTTARSSNTQ